MQGFLVKPNSSGNITFNTSMLSLSAGSSDDASFFRKESEENSQLVKLALSGQDNYNEIIIGFMEDATAGKDFSLDGEKYSVNEEMSFYSSLDQEPFAIQALPSIIDPVQVKLGMNLAKEGIYEFSVVAMENMNGLIATIIDNQTGRSYEIEENTTIQFSSETVESSNRFLLEVRPKNVLALESVNSELSVFGNQKGLEVYYTSATSAEVYIHDLSGKVHFHDVLNFENDRASIKATLSKNQLYVLSIGTQSVKFIIKK